MYTSYKVKFGIIINNNNVEVITEGRDPNLYCWMTFNVNAYDGNGNAVCESTSAREKCIIIGDWVIDSISLHWDWRFSVMRFVIGHIDEHEQTITTIRKTNHRPINRERIDWLLELGLTDILQISKKCRSIYDFYQMRLEEHENSKS